MKCTVKHACGHLQTHQLYGSARERDRKAAWLAQTQCTECWKARQQQAAVQTTAQWNLPPLEGTERQIAWATQLRAEFVDHEVSRIENDPRTQEHRQRMVEALVRAIKKLTKASFWIDNRSNLRGAVAPYYEAAWEEIK